MLGPRPVVHAGTTHACAELRTMLLSKLAFSHLLADQHSQHPDHRGDGPEQNAAGAGRRDQGQSVWGEPAKALGTELGAATLM